MNLLMRLLVIVCLLSMFGIIPSSIATLWRRRASTNKPRASTNKPRYSGISSSSSSTRQSSSRRPYSSTSPKPSPRPSSRQSTRATLRPPSSSSITSTSFRNRSHTTPKPSHGQNDQNYLRPHSRSTFVPIQSLCDYPGSSVFKRGEFYQLPTIVTPERYRLRFRYDLPRGKMYGHLMISVNIHNRTSVIELNAVKLVINGASFRTNSNMRLNAQMVYYCPEKETAVLQFPKSLHKGRGNLTINFVANTAEMANAAFFKTVIIDDDNTDTETSDASRRSTNKHDSKLLVMNDFGPIDARRQFPCWDEPRFKTQFDLYQIVPRNNFALFNVRANRRREYSRDFDEIRFNTSPPLSTFQLTTLFFDKFHVTAAPKISTASNDTTMILQPIALQIVTPHRRNDADWTFALETGGKLFQFFRYYFNQNYALDKLDLVPLRSYEQTSMEKLGLILFPERQLIVIANRSDATEEHLIAVAEALAHSLAHQWIGNSVTFERWNDFWLFEALATFMEREAIEAVFPHWRPWERTIGGRFRRALRTDASRYAAPLANLISHPNDILQSYPNEDCYHKAVALLRMLRSSIGDDSFQRGIRFFVHDFANRTATADDLWRSFERAVSTSTTNDSEAQQFQRSVIRSIAQWTDLAGYPIVHIDERQEGEMRTLVIKQERFVELRKSNISGSENAFANNSSQIWPIPISVVNAFNPFAPSHHAIITEPVMELAIGEIWEGEWIKLNPDFGNFYRVHYAAEMLDKFAISIEEKLLSPMDRLNLVDDLFALIRAGYTSTDVGLRFLLNYENDDNPNVWRAVIGALREIDLLISSSEDSILESRYRQYGEAILAKMYQKLGWYSSAAAGASRDRPIVGQKMRVDDFSQAQLREHIICTAGRFRSAHFVSEAEKKFNDYLNGVSDLPIELLECVFRAFSDFGTADASGDDRRLEEKNQTTFEQLFDYYRNYDFPEARNLFSIALGSAKNADQIDAVINFSLESIVRAQDTHTMLKEISDRTALGRRLVIAKLENHFFNFAQKLGNHFNTVLPFLRNIVETFSRADQISTLKKLLTENSNLNLLHENLRYSFERVKIFEHWYERDQVKIMQYFEEASAAAAAEPLPNAERRISGEDDVFDEFENESNDNDNHSNNNNNNNRNNDSSSRNNEVENNFFNLDDEFDR